MPRDDRVLTLWNINDLSGPSHGFDGPLCAFESHSDLVKG